MTTFDSFRNSFNISNDTSDYSLPRHNFRFQTTMYIILSRDDKDEYVYITSEVNSFITSVRISATDTVTINYKYADGEFEETNIKIDREKHKLISEDSRSWW